MQATRASGAANARSLRAISLSDTSTLTFLLYVGYSFVEFLNLGVRFSSIGVLRPSMVLFGLILAMLIFQGSLKQQKDDSFTTKVVWVFIAYLVISLPFVEWPGSVIKENFQEFLKAAVFFFFTVQIVDTEKRLKWFIIVVIGCQLFRVIEPLYLHQTAGYWGSGVYGGGEFLNRLAGAPSDVVNPNGLGFVIITALPFLHYLLLGSQKVTHRICYFIFLPLLMYALILTGSRSSLVGLFVIIGMLLWKSRNRGTFLLVLAVAGAAAVAVMSPQQADRFVSLVDNSSGHAGSRQGRIRGMIREFEVGLNRPIFGHGLGTGSEAKWNVMGGTKVPHNMYAEAFIELGFIGLVLFCALIYSFVRNAVVAKEAVNRMNIDSRSNEASYLSNLSDAVHVWIVMALVFSVAQYGISEFHWYLVGGVSVVLYRLAVKITTEASQAEFQNHSKRTSRASIRLQH